LVAPPPNPCKGSAPLTAPKGFALWTPFCCRAPAVNALSFYIQRPCPVGFMPGKVVRFVLCSARNARQDSSRYHNGAESVRCSAAAIGCGHCPPKTLTGRIYAGQGRQVCGMLSQKRKAGFKRPPWARRIRSSVPRQLWMQTQFAQYMPPMPAPPAGAAGSGAGMSVTMDSVVRTIAATEVAF